MTLDEISLTKINDRAAESAEQDQTARKCSQISPYTLLKLNPWLRAARISSATDKAVNL